MSTRMPIRTGSHGVALRLLAVRGRIDLDPLDGLLADRAAALVPDLVAPLALRPRVGAVLDRAGRAIGLREPRVDGLREHALCEMLLAVVRHRGSCLLSIEK